MLGLDGFDGLRQAARGIVQGCRDAVFQGFDLATIPLPAKATV